MLIEVTDGTQNKSYLDATTPLATSGRHIASVGDAAEAKAEERKTENGTAPIPLRGGAGLSNPLKSPAPTRCSTPAISSSASSLATRNSGRQPFSTIGLTISRGPIEPTCR